MSRREKKLLLVLPAVAVAGVYAWFFGVPQIKRVEASQKAVQAMKAKLAAPSPPGQAAALAQDMRKDAADIAVLKARWEAAAGGGKAGPSRPERIERVNGILAAAGLTVLDQADADAPHADKKVAVPAGLAKSLAEMAGPTKARPRVVTFAGSYPQALAALRALAAADLAAVPLGLAMKPADGSTRREWTLLIWV